MHKWISAEPAPPHHGFGGARLNQQQLDQNPSSSSSTDGKTSPHFTPSAGPILYTEVLQDLKRVQGQVHLNVHRSFRDPQPAQLSSPCQHHGWQGTGALGSCSRPWCPMLHAGAWRHHQPPGLKPGCEVHSSRLAAVFPAPKGSSPSPRQLSNC